LATEGEDKVMAKKRRAARGRGVGQLPLEGAFPPYLADVAKELSRRYRFVGDIKSGKTGLTCKIANAQNETFLYCLKTIKPDIEDPSTRTKIRQTLDNEVKLLSPLSHRCLPSVYEWQLSGEQPFYICTYHPGATFGEFRSHGKRLSLQEAVFAIWSLIDVLKYLHVHGRTHCDLHQNNVMISENVLQDGILVIDFGSGHRESDSSVETSNRGNVNFKDIRGQSKVGDQVHRDSFREEFAKSDFHALGNLLGIMRDSFFGSASPVARSAYDDFCRSLQNGLIETWSRVEEKFLTVQDPYRIVTANSALFVSAEGYRQEIPLPATRGVRVGEAPLAVINTSIFQRLRGIKQLSFCDWYFPGANHTRFEHSLGVFGVAKAAVESLVHDRIFRDVFTEKQIRGLMLAALVHDVGHYPYAHVLEQYAASRFPDNDNIKLAVSHEKHTIQLLEQNAELREAIRTQWGEDVQRDAIKILEGRVPILSEVLDGPIDIDKMDYLPRDAIHCGVTFGAGLDVDGLLRSLRCVNNANALGVEDGGVSAAEGLMILQDQMLSSVYWHAIIRGVICMFHAVLAYLVKTDAEAFLGIVNDLKNCKSDQDALLNVFRPRIAKFKGSEREQLSRLVELHVSPRFQEVYTPIKTYRATDDPHPHARDNVYRSLVQDVSQSRSSLPIKWDWVRDLRHAFIDAFMEKGISMERLHLVIDVPYGKNSRRMVYVQNAHGSADFRITDVSHLNPSIFERPAAYLSPVRVYVAPDVYNQSRTRLRSIIESAEERFFDRKPAGEDSTTLEEVAHGKSGESPIL
jgi:HD superfamily phosphohydrolase